jgi:hypothetical protein
MKRFQKQRAVLALILLVATLLTVFVDAHAQGGQVNPNVLYQRAWRLIRENYYDQSSMGRIGTHGRIGLTENCIQRTMPTQRLRR